MFASAAASVGLAFSAKSATDGPLEKTRGRERREVKKKRRDDERSVSMLASSADLAVCWLLLFLSSPSVRLFYGLVGESSLCVSSSSGRSGSGGSSRRLLLLHFLCRYRQAQTAHTYEQKHEQREKIRTTLHGCRRGDGVNYSATNEEHETRGNERGE